MTSELNEMRRAWETLGISSDFSKVHHFSSDSFKTRPPGLSRFYNWCVAREIEAENLQTVRRALEAAKIYRSSKEIDAAIQAAWRKYPVIMR